MEKGRKRSTSSPLILGSCYMYSVWLHSWGVKRFWGCHRSSFLCCPWWSLAEALHKHKVISPNGLKGKNGKWCQKCWKRLFQKSQRVCSRKRKHLAVSGWSILFSSICNGRQEMNVWGKCLLFYCCLCLMQVLEVTWIRSGSFLCLKWLGCVLPKFDDDEVLPLVTANTCFVSCDQASWLELGLSRVPMMLAVLEGFPSTPSADTISFCWQQLGADQGTEVFVHTMVSPPY